MTIAGKDRMIGMNRSMGVKLIVIGLLALGMTIPALLVYSLIADRRDRAAEVSNEIGQSVGGSQTFLGPVLIVPVDYATSDSRRQTAGDGRTEFNMVVYPEKADAMISAKTEVRHRSLYKVPIYRADLTLTSKFNLEDVNAFLPEDRVFNWDRAYFAVGTSDTRGAISDPTLDTGGKTYNFAPIDQNAVNFRGFHPNQVDESGRDKLNLFGVAAGPAIRPGAAFDVTARLHFAGAQHLGVIPWGKTTSASMHADWASPSFNGGFLPVSQKVNAQGFDASWSVPFIARGVPAAGQISTLATLAQSAIGVTFTVVADPYQSVARSLKYAILFLTLVFLTYFIFEVTTQRRVHPAQYVLVGVAQIIFYLLLVAFAERVGFDAGFGIAAIATVGLLSIYARWVFVSTRYGVRALVFFSLLYGLIYILLRLEDEALLVGSVASFAVIAAVMYVTRSMDWYSTMADPAAAITAKNADSAP